MTGQNPIAFSTGWLDEASGSLSQFSALTSRSTQASDAPLAADIQHNIPVYHGHFVNEAAETPAARRRLLTEWTAVLARGPGILVIKQGISNHDVIDQATSIFEHLIDTERLATGGRGDHFAKAGANDRVWNALEKHCLHDPHNFAHYYATHAINMAAEAWLGPAYQMTAQINRVNPGGAAQNPHRDYHLGFMTVAQAAAFPAHTHTLSPFLTLQGAVAHCDMPVESGPTQLLPFSQTFCEGYLAFTRPEFQDYFAQNYVQVPLQKGDLLFLNPAVMHAAGENVSSDIYRMANLLQVSSAFGRAMEAINRHAMSIALYPTLLQANLTEREQENAIASCAEGYAFPTSLDRDPPVDGLAPKSQAQFLLEALKEEHDLDVFAQTLNDLRARRLG